MNDCWVTVYLRRYDAGKPSEYGERIAVLVRSRLVGRKGVWGESGLAFESIVEEVRRFVARRPPVDSTTGSVCCPRSFSALEDQRAEILPVQRPPALAVGGRCMMRLMRILMFPFFSLSITDQLSSKIEGLPQCPENFPGNSSRRIHACNRPVNLVEKTRPTGKPNGQEGSRLIAAIFSAR
jgi:hypothetical protein